jgi:hypothetical protein
LFPDFSGLSKVGDELTQQFGRIIQLLEKIERNTRREEKYTFPAHAVELTQEAHFDGK